MATVESGADVTGAAAGWVSRSGWDGKLRSRSGGAMMEMGSVRLTTGVGAFVNLAAALTVAAGAAIKGRAEKLF